MQETEFIKKINERIRYDKVSGSFSRISSTRKVGFIDAYGYLCVGILGKYYKAHRIAWLLTYGKWPDGQIDHIDRNKINNKISNLRDVSASINQQNSTIRSDNTSGQQGVCKKIKGDKEYWIARIQTNGRRIFLGGFKTAEAAGIAYREAKKRMHS